jgi:hypothetical protein
VLALYEENEGTLKCRRAIFVDSRLVTHYQLEFNQSNGKPRMYSIKVDSILHVIVTYEAIQYPQPLVPQVRCIDNHREQTVLTVLPRKEWAKMFLDWTKEVKERHETMTGMLKNRLEWKSNT